jgi:hypothetical protein
VAKLSRGLSRLGRLGKPVHDLHGAEAHAVAADLAPNEIVADTLVLGSGTSHDHGVEIHQRLRQVAFHTTFRVGVGRQIAVERHGGKSLGDGVHRSLAVTTRVLPGGDTSELLPSAEGQRRSKGRCRRGRQSCLRLRHRSDAKQGDGGRSKLLVEELLVGHDFLLMTIYDSREQNTLDRLSTGVDLDRPRRSGDWEMVRVASYLVRLL